MIRAAEPGDLDAAVQLAVAQQRRLERYVGYLGDDAHSIRADLVDEGFPNGAHVSVDESGRLNGFVLGPVDDELDRVWWFGPFVDADAAAEWHIRADELYEAHRSTITVAQEEICADARAADLIAFAERRGLERRPGSLVLHAPLPLAAPPAQIEVVPIGAVDGVAALHDRLFEGSHLPGSRLHEHTDQQVRVAALVDGELAGYVAAEIQGGDHGYVDFVGVAESARRLGIGSALVGFAAAWLHERGLPTVNLTVKEANDGARAMYHTLGFVEVRVMVPFRIGF